MTRFTRACGRPRTGESGRLCGGDLVRGNKLFRVPAAAKGEDELDAGGHLLDAEVDFGLLVAEEGHLRDEDVEVAVNTKFVAAGGKGQGSRGGLDGGFLLAPLLGKDAQRRQAVFDFLERGQYSLAVAGHGGVVGGAVLFDGGFAKAGVKHRLGHRATEDQKKLGPERRLAVLAL